MVTRMEPRNDTSQRGMRLQKSYALNSVHNLTWQGRGLRHRAAHTAHDGLHDAAADGEDSGHDLHAVAHRHLGGGKADKVPQGIFRPLDLPERGGGLEHAHSEKQHQQAIANALHGAVNVYDHVPNVAALEVLRGLRQQRPQFS